MPTQLFDKGNHVFYAKTGICSIEDIRKVDFSGSNKPLMYYILRPISSPSSVVYVPVNNEELTNQMRPALTKTEIDSILSDSKEKNLEWIDDKNARNSCFHTILSGGIHEKLLLMIRCIHEEKDKLEETKRKLPITDDMDLKLAEKYILEEFSYSLGIPQESVITYIKSAISVS